MRALLQRVQKGSVTVDDNIIGRIGPGFVVLLRVKNGDDDAAAEYLATKIINLRIF